MRNFVLAVVMLSCLRCGNVMSAELLIDAAWPQWRGPYGTGAVANTNPPTEWSETKNVKWKIKIPGQGSSTPIIVGNKIFIQTAIPTGKAIEPAETDANSPVKGTAKDLNNEKSVPPIADKTATPSGEKPASEKSDEKGANEDKGAKDDKDGKSGGRPGGKRPGGMRSQKPTQTHQFVLLCLDRDTGNTLWQKTVRDELPHEGHHSDHGFSSSSPVTDGKLVIAYFGSRGLHCYDLEGNPKWSKDLGRMQTKNSFGEGSSPALFGNTVVVNWDHEGEDFIVAFNAATGEELWRQPRDEDTTWATPLIVNHDNKPQVITAATKRIRSYDLQSGKQVWEAAGLTPNAIPTPVASDGMVYLTSGFRGNALVAIRLGRTGDLSDTDAIVWSHKKSTPYVPSPLLYDNRLYFFAANTAILSCFDAKTGTPLIETERVEGLQNVYASPVGGGGRVYLVGRNGTSVVIKHADKLEILATNKLDERLDASPAIVGKSLFLRGQESLYCIEEKNP